MTSHTASLSLGSVLQYTFLLLISPILPFIQRFLLAILSLGPVPQHIGLIMDGNRRYARTHPSGPLPVSQGHLSGFNALRSVLEACLHLNGLTTITVYAFAIDNFARDEKEVQSIMELAKKNLTQLAAHGEMLARHSVRLRMIGRRELLPLDVRIAVEKAERMTQRNTRATLNVCIPYASKDEIAYAVNRCVQEKRMGNGHGTGRRVNGDRVNGDRVNGDRVNGDRVNGDRVNGDQVNGDQVNGYSKGAISVQDIDAKMMLAHSPPLDVLVRTSGVCRLSDFMLWQSTNSQLQFTQRYWPLFGLRELVPIILDYQRMKMRSWLEERVQ